MKVRGLSLRWINLRQRTQENGEHSAIIQLSNAGVSTDYFLTVQAFGAYSVDDIIQFRRRGVGTELIQAANPPDREPLSAEAVIELRNRGVSPKSVSELRK